MAERHLEIAVRYLYTNLLPFPAITLSLVALLHVWRPLAPLVSWAAITILAWVGALYISRGFLRDSKRGTRLPTWTVAICAIQFVSTACFVMVAPLSWVEGDRLNNVLLYVVLAAGLASAGAQAAPSLPILATNLTAYALTFLYCSLAHEAWPLSAGLAFLQSLYIGLVVLYSHASWGMTHQMLELRDEKRSLIDRLKKSLDQSTSERARAVAASRAKSEFLANMSHELRTPLNAILGFSELLRDDSFAPRRGEYAGLIHESGHHLLALINDILDLAKIEAGRVELRDEQVSIGTLTADCVELMKVKARAGGIAIADHVDPGLPWVRADARALKQIMLNLLSNAVKFTPAEGKVSVFARLTALGEMEFGVEDSGIGIAEEDLSRVFENFGQGRHDAIDTENKGTGLGLAIVKGLATALGGSVSLRSRLNHGTCVTVVLPPERVTMQEARRAIA